MAWLAKDSGGDGFEPVPAGTHIARCISVVDIGVQDTPWGGKEKCYLGFEIPGTRVEWKDKEGKEHEGPAMIGNRYTFSIHKDSHLGQHLTSWRGKQFTEDERKGFSLFNVLGAPCMINVIHTEKNGKTYANIQSIMRLPKGTECPPAESELIGYSPMEEQYAGNFDKLADWQKKLVRMGYNMAEGSTVVGSASEEAQEAAHGQGGMPPGPVMGQDDFDDDIPF